MDLKESEEIKYHPEILSLHNQRTDPSICNEGNTKAGDKLGRVGLKSPIIPSRLENV